MIGARRGGDDREYSRERTPTGESPAAGSPELCRAVAKKPPPESILLAAVSTAPLLVVPARALSVSAMAPSAFKCVRSIGCVKGSGRGKKSSESVPIGIIPVGFCAIAVATTFTPTIALIVFAAAGTLVGSLGACQVASDS